MVAPKDVYAVNINNLLEGPVNATVTFSKGMTNELLVEKKTIPAGDTFKSGPYDYEEVRGCVGGRGCVRGVCVLVWSMRKMYGVCVCWSGQ